MTVKQWMRHKVLARLVVKTNKKPPQFFSYHDQQKRIKLKQLVKVTHLFQDPKTNIIQALLHLNFMSIHAEIIDGFISNEFVLLAAFFLIKFRHNYYELKNPKIGFHALQNVAYTCPWEFPLKYDVLV